MDRINWGIIGCGDVTEVKSGPAFSKVDNSSLVAVMRRDAAKAEDYARRHQVPRWYSDAYSLINDPGVNAIYVATPPSTHLLYADAAIRQGKPVYVEKPMTLDADTARQMAKTAADRNIKLTVAHYRREQPLFKKIKSILEQELIGRPLFAQLELYKKPLTATELLDPKIAWRVDRKIAGGGLFHDLAPHQLDILYYFFGEVHEASGYSLNQGGLYSADDIVSGTIHFKNGVLFSGTWCFNVSPGMERDRCEIVGTKGKISFSVFDPDCPVILLTDTGTEEFSFDKLQHVQQPMIQAVVNYFLGQGPNPCSGREGAQVMELIDRFTN